MLKEPYDFKQEAIKILKQYTRPYSMVDILYLSSELHSIWLEGYNEGFKDKK